MMIGWGPTSALSARDSGRRGARVDAEKSSFSARSGIPSEQLSGMYFATRLLVAPEYRNRGLSILLIYILLREARIADRGKVIALMGGDEAIAQRITRAQPLRGIPPLRHVGHLGREISLHAVQTDVNYAMYQCWTSLEAGPRRFVEVRLLADEVIRTVLRLTTICFENPWFKRVSDGTLTRGNTWNSGEHQFALDDSHARAAGITADGESGTITHSPPVRRDRPQ